MVNLIKKAAFLSRMEWYETITYGFVALNFFEYYRTKYRLNNGDEELKARLEQEKVEAALKRR